MTRAEARTAGREAYTRGEPGAVPIEILTGGNPNARPGEHTAAAAAWSAGWTAAMLSAPVEP